nr:MAG TPA_asm: hypothetical protein [Caudoviricetes sp.]
MINFALTEIIYIVQSCRKRCRTHSHCPCKIFLRFKLLFNTAFQLSIIIVHFPLPFSEFLS